MRYSFLSASIITIVFLNACAEAPQSDLENLSTSEQSETVSVTPGNPAVKTQKTPALNTTVGEILQPTLSGRYQGLDPKDITQAELNELTALQKEQRELRKTYQEELQAWQQLDPASRGQWPQQVFSPREQEINARMQILNGKVQLANIRKQYSNIDPKILSKEEAEELITLQQAQLKSSLEYQKEALAWANQDPSTRGQQPPINNSPSLLVNPRLQELQAKVQSANRIKGVTDRIEKLSATHNISISDGELSELTSLEIENQKLQAELNKAMMEAHKNGEAIDPNTVIDRIPEPLMRRMIQIEQRRQAIQAPLLAAEKAERIRKQITKLSTESGVVILSGELEEAIALNAEKDRIQAKIQNKVAQKWLSEGGPINLAQQPLPNDEEYARLKEIDARLKAISAPMNEAKNAALEANNPILRQRRLEKEKQQKWRDDWQDKKQSGEIPPDAIMHSPTYAEIQDRVKDYGTKLKTRADKVGYNVLDADLKRLESLNEEMLAIRKKLYDMEADGSAMVASGRGRKSPTFALTSGLNKIGMIERKQREILAGLWEAETSALVTSNQNGGIETGRRQFNQRDFARIRGQHYNGVAEQRSGAEALIESFRGRGIEVSQAEADELIAFERSLEGR